MRLLFRKKLRPHLISEYIILGFYEYQQDELRGIFRKSLTVIAGAGLFLTTSAYLAAPILADIFVGYDETLAALTVRGFRFFSLSFLLNGFCMYGSAFFTALNNGFISSVISLLQCCNSQWIHLPPMSLRLSIHTNYSPANFYSLIIFLYFLWNCSICCINNSDFFLSVMIFTRINLFSFFS